MVVVVVFVIMMLLVLLSGPLPLHQCLLPFRLCTIALEAVTHYNKDKDDKNVQKSLQDIIHHIHISTEYFNVMHGS